MSTKSIFKLVFLLSTAYMAVLPLNIPPLSYLLRIPSLLLIVLLILKQYKYSRSKFGLSIIVLMGVFLVHFMVDTPLTIDVLLSTFSVLAFLLLIIVSDTITIDFSTQRFINLCSISAACILLAYSRSPLAHMAVFEGQAFQTPYLTYGYENSNFAGIITLLVFSLIFITLETAGKKMKILCYVLGALLFYCMYETNTRSALSVAIIIPFSDLIFRKIHLKNWMLAIVCLIPILFVPFYMHLASVGNADGVEVMGKSVMSGRQYVYESYIARMHGTYEWIMGNLADNKLMNAHNGPLAILASCGILGFIAYFNIFFSKLFSANKRAVSHLNILAVFIIAACFLNTCGEAALLLGGFPVITYLFTFFVFAHSKNKYNDRIRN